jgi:anti-sigma B factor antagonist
MFNLEINKRKINDIIILDLDGKILIGNTGFFFGKTLANLSADGQNQILLNFAKIVEIDGSGLGEIIKSFNSLSNFGGKIKIVNLTQKILELLTITKLLTVFEVFDNESEAIKSFKNGAIQDDHEKPIFVREPHHEAEDDDLGLPEHPIYSNYSKYLWTSRKKTIKF